MQCSSEELAEVILPCLVPSLTLWQYLSLRADAASRSSYDGGLMSAVDKSLDNVDLAVMLDEYAALHREVQNMCNQKLEVGLLEKPVEDASGCEHDPIKSESTGAVNDVLAMQSTSTLNDRSLNNVTNYQHVSDDLEANRTDLVNYQNPRADQVSCVDTAVISTCEKSVVNNIAQLTVDASDVGDITSTADLSSVSAESSTDTTVKHSESAIDQIQVYSKCNSSNEEEALLSIDIENGVSSSPQIESSVPAAVMLDSDALKVSYTQ